MDSLAVGSEGLATVWNAATGKEVTTMRGHDGSVVTLAWSPDGKWLATGSADRSVRVWNAATGKELWILRDNRGFFFTSVAWSPDSSALPSGVRTGRR